MATAVEVHKYPEYRYDEELERETDELEGYVVFSSLDVTEQVAVRAVVRNKDGTPARPNDREWWPEWHFQIDKSHAHAHLVPNFPVDRTTQAAAVRVAKRLAPLVNGYNYRYVDAALAAWQEHQATIKRVWDEETSS